MMRKAIITLATNHYAQIWNRWCRHNWNHWASRQNYDVYCFETSLDDSARARNRSHAWQKLLAAAHERWLDYDYCFWLDADILINPKAPDPCAQIQTDRISVTMETGSPLSGDPIEIRRSWEQIYRKANSGVSWRNKGYFQAWGFNSAERPLFNTGVIGFNPKKHGQWIREVYESWEECKS